MTKNVSNDTKCVTLETSKIQLSDISDIISIANICFPEPWPDELFVSEINSKDSVCIKITEKNIIIGYIIGRYFVDELHIMHLAILPEHRRKGLAQHLVRFLLDNYKAEKYILEVRTSNNAAIELYRKIGFTILGIRKNYYSNGEDAIVMSRGKNNA